MRLSELQPGTRCCVVETGSGIPVRALEMGILPGAVLEVARVAPFGCPLSLKLKSCELAIRLEDAACIQVHAL